VVRYPLLQVAQCPMSPRRRRWSVRRGRRPRREEIVKSSPVHGVDGADGVETPQRSLAETAYALIKRAIIRCDLEPGQQVTEEQLAERFGLGRAAVRPALKRLYQEQLVQTISRQRYVVPPITLKEAHDLVELRLLLEPAAARKAAGRVDPIRLKRLNELCCAQYQLGDRESAEAFLRANTEFHVTVARASGNEIMAEVIANLLDREERLNHLAHVLHDRNADAYHEHHELVEALVAGDGERAEQVMADQIRAARAFVIEALTSSPSIQSVNVTRSVTPNGRQPGGRAAAGVR
jgi:DNA-binding GntR family transcriptional regulator